MIFTSFRMFLRQIYRDSMLVLILVAPLLAGTFFRFAIPVIEGFLAGYFGSPILSPFYQLIDLFLSLLSPYMFLFASTMVLLEERDEGIAVYLSVTPVGRNGYIFSRLILPSLIALVVTFCILTFFSLVPGRVLFRFGLSVSASVLALTLAFLVFFAAGNRIEGMALVKAASIVLVAVAVPFFIRSPLRFLLSSLPRSGLGKRF
jgi:fluoroquinolone transport system permease protein